MSIATKQPFASFLFSCLDEYRRESLPEGKFSRRLWEEKVEEFHTAWHAANDKKRKVTPKVVSSDADAIYALYPRKVGPNAAKAAILRALAKVPYEVMVERVKAYAAATERWPKGDREFIPHPATWFNKGHYDDDPNEWHRVGERQTIVPPKVAAPACEMRQMTDDERRQAAALFTNLTRS